MRMQIFGRIPNPMNAKNRFITIAGVLVSCFALSVLIRAPKLNQPLGRPHYETVTARILRTMQIIHHDGSLRYLFLPISTFGNKGDKNIVNQFLYKDEAGNYYNVSYPPFGHIMPLLVFYALGVSPDVLPLQIFNLVLHFFTALFVYLIVTLITPGQAKGRVNIPALLAFLIYVFAPGCLWFHSNVYTRDILVQPFFVIAIFLTLKILRAPVTNPIRLALLGLVTFLMVYTEWLGLLYAAAFGFYALFRFKSAQPRLAFIVICIASTAALALTLFHYSQIDGLDNIIRYYVHKYFFRSGFTANSSKGLSYFNMLSYKTVVRHYLMSFLPILLFLLVVLVMFFAAYRRPFTRASLQMNQRAFLCFYFCLMPVILHHALLFNQTAEHEFALLKTGVFIAVFSGFIYYKLSMSLFTDPNDENRQLKRHFVHLLFTLVILLSVAQYAYHNRKDYLSYKTIGEEIAQTAKTDEVVFISTGRKSTGRKYWIRPSLIFYAQRNIARWQSEAAARDLLQQNDCERGIVFHLDDADARARIVKIDYVSRYNAYSAEAAPYADPKAHQ